MKKLFLIVLMVSILLYFSIGLDIPILRQILGFLYLSIIPGFLIVKILNIKKISKIDEIIVSVGLSIALIMLIGFLMNTLFPIFGYLEPLSLMPLLLTVSPIVFVFSILADYKKSTKELLKFNITSLPRIVILICIPILGIFGAWFENIILLFLMIIMIVFIVILTIFFNNIISTNYTWFIVFLIALSLLFHLSLISNYLIGWDVFLEFNVFNLTKSIFYWNANNIVDPYNAMLSVSILPTIFSSFINIQNEWIFKFVFLILYAFVPLILFRTWEEQTGKKIAFLSVFFFMFSPKFYNNFAMRQLIAELFFALLLFLVATNRIAGIKKGILLVVFGIGLVVSHYSTSYIFLFIILFAWILSFFFQKRGSNARTISFGFVILFLAFSFSWYTYISSAPSNVLWNFFNNIGSSFSTNLLNPVSRGETLSEFTNIFGGNSALQTIDNILAKLPYLFIIIGFLGLFINKIKNRDVNFNSEYKFMITANIFILSAIILVPYFGPSLVTTRFFHLTLFLLAPLVVIGGQTFFRWTKKFFLSFKKSKFKIKNETLSIICIILVIIFLFKVGFIYEFFNDVPSSPSLSKERMKLNSSREVRDAFFGLYVPKQDIFCALWISEIIDENAIIYADDISKFKVLLGYGAIDKSQIFPINNNVIFNPKSYIFLRYENIIFKELRYLSFQTEQTRYIDLDEVSSLFSFTNKIYSNNFSEIYQKYE